MKIIHSYKAGWGYKQFSKDFWLVISAVTNRVKKWKLYWTVEFKTREDLENQEKSSLKLPEI